MVSELGYGAEDARVTCRQLLLVDGETDTQLDNFHAQANNKYEGTIASACTFLAKYNAMGTMYET